MNKNNSHATRGRIYAIMIGKGPEKGTNSHAARGRIYASQIPRQILWQYVLSLLGFVVGLAVFVFLSWLFLQQFIWYQEDLLYQFFFFIQTNILTLASVVTALGWAAISYVFLVKTLRYLAQIASAAQQLALAAQTPVELSPALRSMQDQLNLVREQALRNAMAAKEAEQRKNDLIVYLAHDLKTPLTSVIGYLTLLRDEPEISQQLRAKYTGIALDKAMRLEELINEFFDITRFSLTQMHLETVSVNLTRMLEQIASEFQPVLTEKGLALTLRLAPNVQAVCDPDKLERVFDNLLRNAVSYCYPETAILLVLEQKGERVVVEIQNHGRTIPPEKLSRIFEQFFRADASRASATGGAGLGLAIAKEIIELHGGSITAESAEETICFTVTLPVHP